MKNIVTIKFGSHLYGTSTAASDIDYKSIHIPDVKDIILQRTANSIVRNQNTKIEGEKNAPGDIDDESYSLHRFFELAVKGEIVAVDMLFAPPEAIIEGSELWDYIQKHRSFLISKRSTAFVGYCRGQAAKYGIKGSRVAAAQTVAEFFWAVMGHQGPTTKLSELAEFLPCLVKNTKHTSIVEDKINGDGTLGLFLECCDKRAAYSSSVKSAYEIFQRVYEGYGARAKLAQSNEGVDWKALSHAVRVGYEAIELLGTGHVTFPLVQAAHILEIKQGKVPYSVVGEEIERLLVDVEAAVEMSTLPEKPDMKFIEDLVFSSYYDAIRGNDWFSMDRRF